MKGYRFRRNEEVAHIGNLSQKLFVKRLQWKTSEVSTGILKKDSDGFVMEQKVKLDGVIVNWWDGPKLQEHKFHAEQLVPWWVAEKGLAFAEEWLEEMIAAGRTKPVINK